MPEDLYSTSDLGLAAILLMFGFEFLEIQDDRNATKRKFFAFSVTSPECSQSAIEVGVAYFDKKLSIEPYEFYGQQKMLKGKLYDYTNGKSTLA